MKLLIASNNQHKISEIKLALQGRFESICSLQEDGIACNPQETGKTFLENALLKANAVAQYTDKAVLADDTGLCVNALNGRPGIYSARYACSHDGAANRIKLLYEMKDKKDRSAYFTTTVVLRYPDGSYVTANGRVDGYILTEEHGSCGFGYDSLFFCPELNKSFAEATEREKLSVSHRGRAIANLLNKLDNAD